MSIKSFLSGLFKKKSILKPIINDGKMCYIRRINVFHLVDEEGEAFCGEKKTLPTDMSISQWGVKTQLNEKYCPSVIQ